MQKKILLAKPGLDGHDVGVKVLAHALIENGHTVIYTGLRKSVEDIIKMAHTEKPDLIGLSILSGTHGVICERMSLLMKSSGLNLPWVVGGNIPLQDIDSLEKLGAKKAFPTGTTIEQVIQYINQI